MKMIPSDLRNQKGFTLIEIITVLVILGILASVAIPRYLGLADEARIKAAQLAIAEVKGRLASAQAKYMMHTGGIPPTSLELFDYATGNKGYGDAANLANVGEDFDVTVEKETPIRIKVTAVQKAPIANITGNFKTAGD